MVLAVLAALGVPACTTVSDQKAEPSAQSPAPTMPPTATHASSPAPSSASTSVTDPVSDPVSLAALMSKEYDGRALRLGRVLLRTGDYTRHAVTYRSDGLRISGILNLPRGEGPFPVLVLLHGYIDPAVYVTGQGLMREQDYLGRRGYAVLHTDYRGHAGSDADPGAEVALRLGYTVDVINAVLAVRRSGDPRLDGSRVGLVGRSMGGGIVYNVLVAAPGLVDAAVAFAPVSSRTEDNFNRWILGERSDLARRIIARHGSPQDAPDFWAGVSPRTYFGRISEPLLIHHGTSDDSCPIRWTRATHRALRAEGKDVRLFVYPGEEHAFGPQWPASMRRTVGFLERHLAQ